VPSCNNTLLAVCLGIELRQSLMPLGKVLSNYLTLSTGLISELIAEYHDESDSFPEASCEQMGQLVAAQVVGQELWAKDREFAKRLFQEAGVISSQRKIRKGPACTWLVEEKQAR
jgi:hypothetical protein